LLRSLLLVISMALACAAAPRRMPATGLVLDVDMPERTITISHNAVTGYMEAMTMPFHVRDAKMLRGLKAGDNIAFTLVVDRKESWLEDLRAVPFESAERDPALAGRLRLLDSVTRKSGRSPLAAGELVPDFTLTDQQNRAVSLRQFRGKVVALNFVYTRCPLPDYCFRLSNNFGRLQKRFRDSGDVVLLTVTFDPVHDQPDVLARYAAVWSADPEVWHFLTGSVQDVDRVCESFGVARWQDDGLFTHSLRTVVIDRDGVLAANVDGNRFSAQQLGDLVAFSRKHPGH
jgi:protein SCO1/2